MYVYLIIQWQYNIITKDDLKHLKSVIFSSFNNDKLMVGVNLVVIGYCNLQVIIALCIPLMDKPACVHPRRLCGLPGIYV